jgi:uncharacterized protein (DUF2344 family)
LFYIYFINFVIVLWRPVSNISGVPGWAEISSQIMESIETKLRLIKFTQEQAEKLVETNNVLAMGWQIKTLTTKVGEVHDIKVKIQELKIEKGENIEDIQTWNAALEDKLFAIETQISDLDNSLKRIGSKGDRSWET